MSKIIPTSLYEQLSGALALDGRSVTPPASLTAELQGLRLDPLTLPESRRPAAASFSPGVVGFLALAAAVVLMVFSSRFAPVLPELDFGFTVKGAEVVRLYWERQGEVRGFTGPTLQNGDRVLAEVLVPAPSVAYWGVLNARGELLGAWGDVKASEMLLAAGKVATFPTSLRLVGTNEGETLFVLVCGKNGPDPFPELATSRGGGLSTLAHCKTWKFQLR